jgi:hypothetical protein
MLDRRGWHVIADAAARTAGPVAASLSAWARSVATADVSPVLRLCILSAANAALVIRVLETAAAQYRADADEAAEFGRLMFGGDIDFSATHADCWERYENAVGVAASVGYQMQL